MWMEAMGKQSPIIIVVEDPEVKKQLSQMNAAADLGVASCWGHRAKEEFESEEGRLRLQDLSLKRRRVRKRAASAALFFMEMTTGQNAF